MFPFTKKPKVDFNLKRFRFFTPLLLLGLIFIAMILDDAMLQSITTGTSILIGLLLLRNLSR